MRSDNQHRSLVEEVEYLSALSRQLRVRGPHFIVRHGQHQSGTFCLPGETLEGVSLWNESVEYHFELGLVFLFLLDLLCRFRRTPLSAAQIATILNNDPFYVRYGSNARGCSKRIPRLNPATVRVYLGRLRKHLAEALDFVSVPLDPHRVLIAEVGPSNVVLYKLRAVVEVVHLDGAWCSPAIEGTIVRA
jgi:hypothetical protein